jgi:adenylosuccinate synthase
MKDAKIIVDLGFGDAGKGSIVDYFTKTHSSDLVVRWNGGAQAAHNVVTDTQHHTFRQFGSGSFRGARTLYSKYALFDPMSALDEAKALNGKGVSNSFNLFYVEEESVITSIFQQTMNRIRETARSNGRHGSCGMGIGETANDAEKMPERVLRVKDLRNWSVTYSKLESLRRIKRAEATTLLQGITSSELETHLAILNDPAYSHAAANAYCNIARHLHIVNRKQALAMLSDAKSPIFEGAQGILLDQEYGFYPYITRSDVTATHAIEMCNEAGMEQRVVGLLRSYAVRHGPGPLPTYNKRETARVQEYHNAFDEWQRDFRIGHFDAVLARYALDVCTEVDDLFITCTDRLAEFEKVSACTAYSLPFGDTLPILPLRKVGKEEKTKESSALSEASPVYTEFDSTHQKSSLHYQTEYARFVHKLIQRDVNLLGISRGVKAEDKYLV